MKVAAVSAVPVNFAVVTKSWKTEISFSETFNQTFDGRYGKQWANSIAKTKAIDVKKSKSSILDHKNVESMSNTSSDCVSDSVDAISPLATDMITEMEINCNSKNKTICNETECSDRIYGSHLKQASSEMPDKWKSQKTRNYRPKPTLLDRPSPSPDHPIQSPPIDYRSIPSNRNCSSEVLHGHVKNKVNSEMVDLPETDSEEEIENVHEPNNELMMESLAELLDLDYEDILRINRLPSGDYDIIFKQ